MRAYWPHRPLKQKLVWITLLSSCSALLFASAAFVVYDMTTYRETLTNDLQIRMKVLEINTAAPLAFHDRAAAHENLAPLRADPRLVAAALYDRAGVLFAEYRRRPEVLVPPLSDNDAEVRLGEGYLDLSLPVRLDGEVIGQITVRADLAEQQARLRSLLLIGAGVLLASLAVALLIATRLQRSISGPITELTEVAHRVSQQKDYTVQIVKHGDDEIGVLADSLKAMLQQIHERDLQLQHHSHALELQVAERTTDLVRANEVLQEREARYRHLVDHAQEIIYRMDPDGRIVYFNPTAVRVTSYAREELMGRHYLDLVDADHRHAVAEFYARQLQLKTPATSHEFPLLAKDGRVIWLSQNVHLLLDNDRVAGLQAIARDITERKQMEQALREAHDKLEQLVEARTAELKQTVSRLSNEIAEREQAEAALRDSQEQIRQMQKMEAIGQLAGGIAHDFNNLLTAILGNADIAVSKMHEDDPARPNLVRIVEAGHRASDVVQQILTFTRQQDAARSVVALAPIVMDALTLLRATLPAGVELGYAADPDMPPVLANATQMHQVLMNLCTNAWHALGDGPGHISVDLAAVTLEEPLISPQGTVAPGYYACLSVSDTGCGMDADTLIRIFDPFFTTKSVGQGTGLGLSVVHGIVQSHNGAIVVESRVGEGTTFRVYFPAVDTPDTPPAAGDEVAPVLPVLPEGSPGRMPHVLYVDDEDMLVELVETLLESQGYRVTGCTNPIKAVSLVQSNPEGFDVVVTDYNMPEMSGLDVAEAVTRIRPMLKVVLVSGFMTPLEQEAGEHVPVKEVVYKPTMLQDLAVVLARVLSPGSSQG